MTKLGILWCKLRESFWFLPALIVAFSTALALGLIEVDSSGNWDWMDDWPRLFGEADAEGARGTLATIAGSMMTVVGVTFSMTLVTLARLASRKVPSSRRYEDGELRVISIGQTFARLVAESFDGIRGSSDDNVTIMLKMLSALQTIANLTDRPSRRRVLREQAECIAEMADAKSSHRATGPGLRICWKKCAKHWEISSPINAQ